jgi:hypothetical protein
MHGYRAVFIWAFSWTSTHKELFYTNESVAKTIGKAFPDPMDEARCRLDKNFTSKARNWAQKYEARCREVKSNPFDLVLHGGKKTI